MILPLLRFQARSFGCKIDHRGTLVCTGVFRKSCNSWNLWFSSIESKQKSIWNL